MAWNMQFDEKSMGAMMSGMMEMMGAMGAMNQGCGKGDWGKGGGKGAKGKDGKGGADVPPPPPGAPPPGAPGMPAGMPWTGAGWPCGASGPGQWVDPAGNPAEWKRDGKWKPDYQRDPVAAAIREALEPVAASDSSYNLRDMEERVGKYFFKAAQKYVKDDRIDMKGSPVQAQALVEEFVDVVMGSLAAACYDKGWYQETNFAGPLFACAKQTFGTCKVFHRVLGPSLQRYIEEGLFRFRDEERIQKAFMDAVMNIGLDPSYHKKCNQQLQKSFDEAHTHAPYGTSKHALPSMRVMQDFVLGWMKDFVHRSWDIIYNGVSGDRDAAPAKRDSQLIFLTALFQTICGPELRALPYDIVGLFEDEEMLPPPGWDFVAIAAQSIFEEYDAHERKRESREAKRPRVERPVVGRMPHLDRAPEYPSGGLLGSLPGGLAGLAKPPTLESLMAQHPCGGGVASSGPSQGLVATFEKPI